ncbi:glycosyltransferase family 2 protein [Paenibacillus lentus]|uniref:Glycosyltransferase family 2 protein n=2 Tax=Paenibacillus lentus TaxID=1338368 RepID=A0A3S8S120_9BACL|nr:glycosyltransferase family 2 protein [Paenibacillus lentus]
MWRSCGVIPKIQVLLSTYNGEQYLNEQLESLLAQQHVDLKILIRDDGSRDSTASIIEEFIRKYPQIIKLYIGENKGAKASFFDLLDRAAESSNDFDFIAFCDQDDVWMEEKLISAIRMLENGKNSDSMPMMYCSATQMVQSDLRKLAVWPEPPRQPISIYNALVENIAVGCTTVLNREAVSLLAHNMPNNVPDVIMHDWWAYICVSSSGKVVFDENPHILYRQHTNNALGGGTDKWLMKWINRIKRYSKGKNHYIISNQARVFLETFQGKLPSKQINIIRQLVDISQKRVFQRLSFALRQPFYRQNYMDNLVLKILIILGKI